MYCNAHITVHTMFPLDSKGHIGRCIKVYNPLGCFCDSTDAAFHLLVISNYHLYANIWIQHTTLVVVADLVSDFIIHIVNVMLSVSV